MFMMAGLRGRDGGWWCALLGAGCLAGLVEYLTTQTLAEVVEVEES